MSAEWRSALRAARRASGLSLNSLAEHSGLSYETVRGYEDGRRSPTRESLLKVLVVLRLTAADANALLEQAGFAPDPGLYPPHEFPEYAFRVDELQQFLDKRPWPAIATDDAIHIIAANRSIQALWGIDFDREKRRRSVEEMTLFAIVRDYGLLDRISNWPSFLREAASLNKGRPLRAAMTSPQRRMASMQAMSGADPALLKRMQRIWANAKPMPARIQSDFQVVWRDPEFGEMRFRSVVSVASEQDRLNFRDWHPVDAETWRALENVKSSRLREGARKKRPSRPPHSTEPTSRRGRRTR
jgi:transcriptional regulator with XRE-family HTH domain